MIFTQEQKRIAYKKLSPEVQSFIMDPETTETIENYLKEVGLNETQLTQADSEILYSMYGLQTLAETIANIANLSNKNINDLAKLRINLEDNIFSKLNPTKEFVFEQSSQSTKLDKGIESTVGDIAQKYSLNEAQSTKLSSLIVLSNEQIRESDSFLETIVSELGISRLLAEQIVIDVKNRIEKKPTIQTTVKPPLSRFETTKTIEIRPESLPVVEDPNKIGVPRYVPTNVYKPTSTVQSNPIKTYTPPVSVSIPTPPPPQTPNTGSTITYRPKSNVPDQVQQVTPVPRFTGNTGVKVENKPMVAQSPENKLNNVTTSTLEKTVSEMLPPKGNVDPYREPLN